MDSRKFPTKTAEVNYEYDTFIGGGFAPLPVALERAKGSIAYDVDGKPYIDFLSMIAVNNMGHGHPKIVDATVEAIKMGATINLAFQSPYYGRLAKRVTKMFGYDRFIALTSGGEAADAAMKMARKWGYLVKRIPIGQCQILSTTSCYHGVGLSTMSLASRKNALFGPFLPNCGAASPSGTPIRFGFLEDIKSVFEQDGDRIAAIIVEPIQGASGVFVPPDDYLPGLSELCKKHNILLIADEIQTGLGRCGHHLYCSKFNVRPDLVVIGKALGGGLYPISGVLADNNVMSLLGQYEIGSTMAANPPGNAAALAALDVLEDENLAARATEMGELLISTIKSHGPPHVIEYVGAGLLWAVVIQEKPPKVTSRRLAALLATRGLLVNGIKGGRLRICPPLNIDRELLLKGAGTLVQALFDLESYTGYLPGEKVPFRDIEFVE